MDIYAVLKEKNIVLPEPPPRGGVYSPCKIAGNMVYVSGCGCNIGGSDHKGKQGSAYTVEEGQTFARNCMLNILSVLNRDLGDLNRIKTPVKLLVFVACADDFAMQPQVANGASQLLADIFGAENVPARSAVGVNALPGDMPVEIEAIFELKEE